MLYEALLLVAVWFLASYLFITLTHDTSSTLMKIIYKGYLLLVSAGYFTWFWRHGGQTLAMKTWRMKLVSAQGTCITLKQALLRYIVALIGIPFGGIGIWWALFDRDKQFLHDRVAGTKIISVFER